MIERPIPWLTRLRVSNYKSIASCDVSLGPLTLLIGANGAGKSNFLDAIHFLSEAVALSPYQAVEARGGLGEILNRSRHLQAKSMEFIADVVVPWGDLPSQWASGAYRFVIGARKERGHRPIEVVSESCTLTWRDVTKEFSVNRGTVVARDLPLRSDQIEPDRLLLQVLGSFGDYAPLASALSRMAFYNLNPATIRQPEPEVENALLGPSGDHLGDVLGALSVLYPDSKRRIEAYLGAIVPGLDGIDRQYAGRYVSFDMRQKMASEMQEFGPTAMSDGTVRAAAVLAALFQPAVLDGQVSLVGIEEPELALHPSAAGVLFDAATEASGYAQIIATTQSADLFDRDDVDISSIRVASFNDGRTTIGALDNASQRILSKKLMTVGELMRGNQLSPRLDS